MNSRSVLLSLVACVTAVTQPAPAVILLGSATRNTSVPSGSLAGSGWQFQGQFTGFLATPISSKYFITAQHVGGSIGQDMIYNGQTYFTDQLIDIPNTDLRLWRISGNFPTWAPMYNRAIDGAEAGRKMVVFGRGTQRGEEVFINEPFAEPTPNDDNPVALRGLPPRPVLKGWRWGPEDRVQSWGENTVAEVIVDPDFGDLLYFTFDQDGGANESHLSAGDSGGGVFIQSGGVWKLAGINFAVDGPFRTSPTSPEFFGAIFDAGGLYFGNPPEVLPNSLADLPSGAYSSAISGSLPFILSTIGATASADVPEPAALATVSTLLFVLTRRRRR